MTTQGKDVSRLAKLISDRIEELKGTRSQRDIAEMVGYNNQNMITMIKQGTAKVALDRVPALAEALEVDGAVVMRMALEQFHDPQVVDTMIAMLQGTKPMSARARAQSSRTERRLLKIIRDATHDGGIPADAEEKLREVFSAA